MSQNGPKSFFSGSGEALVYFLCIVGVIAIANLIQPGIETNRLIEAVLAGVGSLVGYVVMTFWKNRN